MQNEQNSGVSDYLQWLRRRLPLLLVVGLSTFLIGVIVAIALPSVYVASAEFRVSSHSMQDASGNESYVDQYVSKLTRDVLSTSNLALVRDKLHLLPEFGDDSAGAAGAMLDNVQVTMVTQKILDPDSGRARDINTGFQVSYDAPSAREAGAVSSALADLLLSDARAQRADQANRNAVLLGDEAKAYGDRVANLEKELADFKRANIGRLPDSHDLNAGVKERNEQDLNGVEQELRALRQNRIFLQAQLAQVQAAGPDVESLQMLEEEYQRKAQTYDVSHPDMVALRRQIDAVRGGRHSGAGASLQAQLETQRSVLAETRQRYSEDHPDVKRIQRNIATLEARIAAGERNDLAATAQAASPVVVQLRTQLNANDAQLASLQQRAMELRSGMIEADSRMRATPEVEREYDMRNRDLTLAREKYAELVKRQMDAQSEKTASLAGGRDSFDLVSAPHTPVAPAKPRRAAIVVLSAVLAAFAGLAAALVAEMIDPAVRGTRDVIQLLGMTPIAVVPEIRNSVYRTRRTRKLVSVMASLALALPLVYLSIWFVSR